MMNWIPVSHLSLSEFTAYLSTVSNDDLRSTEIQRYSKRHAVTVMCSDMQKYISFYEFVEAFSPNDYKLIKGRPHVSQRVIASHIQYWNECRPNHPVRTLRVFFM